MKRNFTHSFRFSRPKKVFKRAVCALLLLLLLPLCFACSKSVNYFDYVSELRSNILLYEEEGFSMRIYAVMKETPYQADGIVGECAPRTEIHLVAPSGEKPCSILFSVNGTEHGGEMSFDNVKTEYYYACPLDISSLASLTLHITYGDESKECTAQSVRTDTTLSPQNVLLGLVNAETELFNGLTDKYGFAGEIHLRLLYEDAPYYYVGVTDRQGNATAFLINAQSGKILAKRQS